MSHDTRSAWFIGPVCAADASGKTGVFCIQAATTGFSITLPSAWNTTRNGLGKQGTGPFVRIKPVGCTLQYAYSLGAKTLVTNQLSGVAGSNYTPNAVTGWPLGDGEPEDPEVPQGCDTLNIVCSNTTGFVFLRMDEGGIA